MFGKTVFIAGAAFAAALLAYVAAFPARFLATSAQAALFLGLPAAGLGLSLAALLLRPAARSVAAGLAMGAVVGAYGFEAYLAFITPGDGKTSPVASGDRRTKYEVVRDLRAAGIPAYPSVFPAYFMQTGTDGALRSPITVEGRETLPLGGVPSVPTVLCNEAGSYVIFDSDRYGFNNPDQAWYHPAVVAVGDSFTQGYCVLRQENYVTAVGAALGGAVNLASSGNGPLIDLAALKEYGPALAAPLVLWFFFEGNDIPGDLAVEARSPLLRRYLEKDWPGQGLMGRADAVGAALRRHIDRLVATAGPRRETDAGPVQAAVSFVGLARLRTALRLPSTLDHADWPLFRRILAEAQRVVRGWGGTLHLVYIPERCAVLGRCPEGAGRRFASVRRHTREIAAVLGVPVIDLLPVLAAAPDPSALYMRRDGGHFGPAGHTLVAATVVARLRARADFPPALAK